MSEIVSGVLKHTFGFLANKIRSEVAKRLEDGDVTDEECRRLIVRELDDIKSKLDGLARKDLLSSLLFLQEGVNRLYQSLLQSPSDENTPESSESVTTVEAASSRDTAPHSPVNEAIALIKAISSLKIHSNERFKSAKESFKLAREKATDAFGNEALSIEDRIQASQIRMMAKILESLEDPDAGVRDCLQYLKRLHDIGGIRETFSVLITGGLKAKFNQTTRLNNASAVHTMNQILFDFARKFTKLALRFSDWPTILVGKRVYHPVLGDDRVVEQLEESGVEFMPPSLYVIFDESLDPECSAVNSKGEIVAKIGGRDTLRIFKRSGESRKLCDVPKKEDARRWWVCAMDVDEEDNIYVITAFQEREDQTPKFNLFIFDANGNKKLECPLPFVQKDWPEVSMAINKQRKIAVVDGENKTVYIGNVCVELNAYKVEKSFHVKDLVEKIRFSYCNAVKIIVLGWRAIYIYTENGELEREIEIPEEYGRGQSLAINHVTQRILITTLLFENCNPKYFSLLQFSESGELLNSLCLGSDLSNNWLFNAVLTSHPSGSVVFVGKRQAAYLQEY